MQKENIDPLFLFENGIGVGTLEKSGYSSAILTNVQLIGSLEDMDGNSYKWVRIGEQTWMAENLRTTKYSNGDEINIDDPFENEDYVEFDNEEYTLKYGRYYHPTIINDSRGLCPTGWHIPDNNEIDILVNSLGGKNIAGAKLKEEGEEQWNFGNNGTNESGFSFPGSGKILNSWGALKNIDLLSDGYFLFLKNNSIDGLHLLYNSSEISYSYDRFQTIVYYSIRCMKD